MTLDCNPNVHKGYLYTPYRGRDGNLRSPMLNSLREWGERRSTRVFALKIAQKHLEFEGVCAVTHKAHKHMSKRYDNCNYPKDMIHFPQKK